MNTSESFRKVSASSTVQYYSYGNLKKKSIVRHPKVKTSNSGRIVFIRIDMGKGLDIHTYKNIALSGQMTTSWVLGEKVKQVGAGSDYGHSVFFGSPSISTESESIEFTPAWRIHYGDEAYAKAWL